MFRYAPLITPSSPSQHSIRLLKLEPANSELAPIRGSLVDVSLEAAPPYEALSYCWGDASAKTDIYLCDECGQEGRLGVTMNLFAALKILRNRANASRLGLWSVRLKLRYGQRKEDPSRGIEFFRDVAGGRRKLSRTSQGFRIARRLFVVPRRSRRLEWASLKSIHRCPQYGPRLLWIDAICVNQQDIEERSAQVRLMRNIFAKCERALVWLGDMPDDVGRGVRLIEHIAARWDGKLVSDSSPAEFRIMLDAMGFPDFEIKGLLAMDAILSSPWFRRKWVIQEVAVPQHVTVICSSHEVDWDVFDQAVRFICELGYVHAWNVFDMAKEFASRLLFVHSAQASATHIRSFITRREEFQNGSRKSLFDLLYDCILSDATDPRDHVFALLGLVNSGSTEVATWQPDYGLSSLEVFVQTTRTLCADSGTLNCLNWDLDVIRRPPSAWSGDTCSCHDLPSWVVDWNDAKDVSAPIRAPNERLFFATKQTKYKGRDLDAAGCLTV
jgi:hypothetical protein